MSAYTCKRCDAPADMIEGAIVRTCVCGVGVIANMEAIAYGEGHVKQVSRIEAFCAWMVALVKARTDDRRVS